MIEQSKNEWKNKGIIQSEELQQLQGKVAELHNRIDTLDDMPAFTTVTLQLGEKENTILEWNKVKETLATISSQLEVKKKEIKITNEQLEEVLKQLEQNKQETKLVNSEGLEQEKQLKALDELLQQNPEEAREKALSRNS